MLVNPAAGQGGPAEPQGSREPRGLVEPHPVESHRPHQGPDPLYYLANFQIMIDTLSLRDGDLLAPEERGFIEAFAGLPQDARALVVRMAMRKGDLFRASRLRYPEIADLDAAAAVLIARGWVDDRPLLGVDEVFSLFTKDEVLGLLGLSDRRSKQRKAAVLAEVRAAFSGRRQTLSEWGAISDTVFRLAVAPLCERLRLMFFGNFRQTLKEFVLADLGIFRYQHVALDLRSRPFSSRKQVEDFLALYRCRQLLHDGADPSEIEHALPARIVGCDWLAERREKLGFQIARAHQRCGNVDRALEIFRTCTHPQARLRAARLEAAARGEHRPRARGAAAIPVFEMAIERPSPARAVEPLVAQRLIADTDQETQVFFVENALINSLFGLLFWPAIFSPVPGAFFHRFHRAPADLSSAGFLERRRSQFAAGFADLDCGLYKTRILERFAASHGIASAFVAWGLIDEPLLRIALECFPAVHMKSWFEWMLRDLKLHRTGFPDLVEFNPRSGRYRLIEVKAPGDRIQDNQRASLEFMMAHGTPVSVCRVRWAATGPDLG